MEQTTTQETKADVQTTPQQPANNNLPAKPEQQAPRSPMTVNDEGRIVFATFDDMWRMAVAMSKSELVPKDYRGKPENCLIAMQYGGEVGFKPMQSLQSIMVINGRPGMPGDAALALVRASGLLEDYSKKKIGEKGKDSYGYEVMVKRKGMSPQIEIYTVADAKTAKLWGKSGPWTDHPDRMLFYRPLGFVLRDNFGDVLKGMVTTEELIDYPEEHHNEPAKPSGPKFDEEAIAASNSTTPIPPMQEKTEPVKAEEAEFQEMPAKAETPETKPEVKLSPKDAQIQAEFEQRFPK